MKATAVVSLLVLLFCTPVHGVDPARQWRTVQTPHFNIHFHDGEELFAARVAAVAERVDHRLSPLLGWRPRERTEVVLSDESDLPNGMTTVVPFGRILLYPAIPDDISGLEDSGDWLETLFVHEYTHLLHLDKAYGLPARLRYLFGRQMLLFPNQLQPAWVTEGLATYMETDFRKGYGRGQSAYYRMLMRREVEQGVKSLRQVNLPLRSWPAGVTNYLYGVYFFRFLEQTYGAGAANALVDDYSDNLVPFRIDSNPRRHFGKDLDQLWRDYTSWLKAEFPPRPAPEEFPGKDGASLGVYGSMVRALADGRVYYIYDDGFRRPYLKWVRGREQRTLVELRKRARIDVHQHAGVLVTQPEICNRYYRWFDLYRYREESGKLQRLTHCARIRWASWSPDGHHIAAIRGSVAGVELQLLDEAGRLLSRLWQGEADTQISHPDWSPDGGHVVAAWWQRGQGWSLRRFNLKEGRWETLLAADGSVMAQPQYSPDGRYLLFVSDHGGVYNLRRLELRTGQVVTLTDSGLGAFHPSQGVPGGEIYYLRFGGDGQYLHRLEGVRPQPLAAARRVTDGATGEIDPRPLASRPYTPWHTLRPRSWFPHLVVVPGVTELGMFTYGEDALGVHGYQLDLAWESASGSLLGLFGYRWSNRFSLTASRYNNYYHDSEADLVRIRQREFAQAAVAFPYPGLDSSWNLRLGVAAGRESDRWHATLLERQPSSSDNLVGAMLLFDSSHLYTRSVSRSDGRRVALTVENSDLLGGEYSGSVLSLDWREYLLLRRQQVLALRMVLGWGTRQPRPFRLGGEAGEGLNLVSIGGQLLNRRNYPLRGYLPGLAALRGRRMQLTSLEWRFPLKLVERGWMAPPLGLVQWSGQLFLDSGAAWEQGSSPGRYLSSAGIELLSDINLFYQMNLRLRLGYAHGFDRIGGDHFYLSLGSSF